MDDKFTLNKLEAGFQRLQDAKDCKSLLKKYLTKDVFVDLKNKKTKFGATLFDCIQSGIENLDSEVGIFAADAESYSIFAPIFNPIIEDYHKGFKPTDRHPSTNFGDINSLVDVDPSGKYVLCTQIRCSRSLQGYAFNPCLTEDDYKEMERRVNAFLRTFEGDLKGKYYPLSGMDKATQKMLIDDLLFKEGDRFLHVTNACRHCQHWPTGRGIYHNDAKTFLVWVNEEDHLRVISMQTGGDVKAVYQRLVTAVNLFEKVLPFSRDDRLGFLNFCPTNLGTALRASVHIAIPKLAKNKNALENIASKFHLQVRETLGKDAESEVYDVSNERRLGLTEYQAVKELQDGVIEMIKLEATS